MPVIHMAMDIHIAATIPTPTPIRTSGMGDGGAVGAIPTIAGMGIHTATVTAIAGGTATEVDIIVERMDTEGDMVTAAVMAIGVDTATGEDTATGADTPGAAA